MTTYRMYPAGCIGYEDRVLPDYYMSLSDDEIVKIFNSETDEELYERMSVIGISCEEDFYKAISDEQDKYERTRPCPSGCGCIEFYDTRDNVVTGGFGRAGCKCERCD